ncbi:LiaF transmembrane domain-containing protein [Rufibacter quisquiliarum]|uniref:Putative membrane protein n=1 Tax=Rufibacter quisquiliarum TaxID=1549639 RepID=A0A839GXT8_9BACT|nr:LiaF domain-containing protein [Rufibacter quisquiliarum]MBA9079647.1 putative membrane protein [Rufibacter quisquiliarum]
MENQEINKTENLTGWDRSQGRGGRMLGGLLVVAVGAVLLAYQLDVLVLPRWVFSWEVILILIGVFTGIRHSFRNPGWIIMVLIGGIFLADDIVPNVNFRPFLWPVLIIIFGLFIMFKPRHQCKHQFRHKRRPGGGVQGPGQPLEETEPGGSAGSKEDYINGTAVFGGIKKNIISKDFKGGSIVTFCGGTEYNLSHADMHGEVVIEVTQIFGGTSLVIPSNWKVRSEVAAVFGGVDEKRSFTEAMANTDKILVLKGTLLFGGIEIKSY